MYRVIAMFDQRDYWEHCFDGIDPDTYDFSDAKPSAVLVHFCENHLEEVVTVLDLGCGNGNNAHYLAERGHEVYGVDISKAAVRFCRKRFARFNLPGTFKRGTFDRIPFPDDFFSCLLCLAGLDHVTLAAAQAAVREMERVLVPSGLMVLTFAPPDTDTDIMNEAETLPDGTLKFVSGIQAGMLFRRYSDAGIRELLGNLDIQAFEYTELGTRVVVCRRRITQKGS